MAYGKRKLDMMKIKFTISKKKKEDGVINYIT
jgi:hypothetical protein